MEINISGRKMSVGDALTEHANDKLGDIAEKYFTRSIDSSATFAKEGHLYRVDVSLHANQGIQLHSHAESDDPYAAFDTAAEKVEKQLRRYKRRLKNHHATPSRDAVVEMVRDTVLAPENEEAGPEAEGEVAEQHLIIAETKKEIPCVSVGDAAMLMDLANTNAFVFRNSKSNNMEVVYKRSDGNIGWISTDD